VRELAEAMLAAKSAILQGPAGIGKSTVTLQAAQQLEMKERFGDRRLFVRCDEARDRAGLVTAIAIALGISGQEIEKQVLHALGQTPTLCILDNLETPWDADRPGIDEFLAYLAGIPDIALVASLRGTCCPGTVDWQLVQEIVPLTARYGKGDAAKEIFHRITRNKFISDPDLDNLLTPLDGIPLAITLLAHVAEAEPSLAGLCMRWKEEKTRLLQDPRHAGNKDYDLAASYELSLDGPCMSKDARRLLSLLAILPVGAATCDLPEFFYTAASAAHILRAVALAYDDAGRLRLLTPLREYVSAYHPPTGGGLKRLLRFYMALIRENGEKFGKEGGDRAVIRLTPETANLEAILLCAQNILLSEEVFSSLFGYTEFARFTGLATTRPLEQALEHAHVKQEIRWQACINNYLANIALNRSDHATAQARNEAALPLYRQVGDLRGEATCIQILGDIALRRSDHATAQAHYEAVLPLSRQVGDLRGEANCIRSLGDIALERSDHATAQTRYEAALPLSHQEGDLLGEANCIRSLGDIALRRSDHATAQARYEAALPLSRQVGDLLGEANCIKSLGDIALRHSDHATAQGRYEAALPLYRQVGDLLGEANCIQSLGDIAMANNDSETAQSQYLSTLDLYQRIPDPYSIGATYSRLFQLTSDPVRREEYLSAAREAWQSIDRQDLIDEYLTASTPV